MTADHDLDFASAAQLRTLFDAREISVEEVISSSLARIDQLNPALNAVVAVRREGALAEARAADQVPPSDRSILHGIPFTVKDVTETRDLPTTYGSVVYAGNQAGYDALVVSRLREAGGILVGKTNTPELACEPVTRSGLFGETHNPWSTDRTPGGSSGGAAAGLAAGLFTLAQGTDAGGSIRIPASCCGVVGLKPTRGLVSLAPSTPEAWGGLIHNGPMARTVRDAATMLGAMSEPTRRSPAGNAGDPSGYITACDVLARQPRIAYTSAPAAGALDSEVAASFADSVEVFRSLGATLVEASPDFSPLAAPFTTIIAVAFAGMGSEMSDDQLAQIGPKVLAWITRGWRICGADYYVAVQTAYRESRKLMGFWDDYDFLLTPTVPVVPPLLRSFPSTEEHDAKWAEFGVWETFTYPANVTGQPAMSLPCRFGSSNGLPIGVQLVGRHDSETEMFSLAAAYETAVDWSRHRPTVPGPL